MTLLLERTPRRGSLELNDLAPSHSCRRRSFTRSIDGTRSLFRSYSEENLMLDSCHSWESFGPGEILERRRLSTGTRRASFARGRYGSQTSLITEMSCRSFESADSNEVIASSSGGQQQPQRRRGGLRRSQSSLTILTTTSSLQAPSNHSLQLPWHGSQMDLNSTHTTGGHLSRNSQRRSTMGSTDSSAQSLSNCTKRRRASHYERRNSGGSLDSSGLIQRRYSKHRSVCRHNSASTMSTTCLVVDEVSALMEEIKQTIKQKVSREVTLQNMIESDEIIARARYLSDNERGAILSMRRVHKFQRELQQIGPTCRKLIGLQKDLETATCNAKNFNNNHQDGILAIILGEFVDSLEQILDAPGPNKDYSKPNHEDLLEEVMKLVGRFEI